jgi:hypothetical protein
MMASYIVMEIIVPPDPFPQLMKAPLALRFFGETGVSELWFFGNATPEIRHRVIELFPEAKHVELWQPPSTIAQPLLGRPATHAFSHRSFPASVPPRVAGSTMRLGRD